LTINLNFYKCYYKFILIFTILFNINCFSQTKKSKVFVYTRTCGYIHESIPKGVSVISELGEKYNFNVDSSDDDRVFDSKILFDFDAVVFLSTTLNVLNSKQQKNLVKFIRSGKGFVGIHAAADTEYDWEWYGKLVGAYFISHPEGQPMACIKKLDGNSFFTDHINGDWKIKDEWYNYQFVNPNVIPLLNLDENSYKGGINGKNHPIAWFHEFQGGRSFYTGLGHLEETFDDKRFQMLILKGLIYAIDGF
tara:strand:- start:10337 stop:11086 length:750 start_codon:yes stop_codon:yes gene_type:complete